MSDLVFSEIAPPPPKKGSVSAYEMLYGAPLPKIDRLRLMSADDFEDMVAEWGHGYLKKDVYPNGVKRFGGAGDKGRDVVGYLADGDIDIYQCKHYQKPLSPSEYWIEFGKLCYYTFNKDYRVPGKYVVVCPNGVGSGLQDFIDNPEKLRKSLIENWPKKCKDEITKKKSLDLSGKLLEYVEKFDFSIVSVMDPLELIQQHSETIHHTARFGGGLTKKRERVPAPSPIIQDRELKYITPLYDAYSEELGKPIDSLESLKAEDQELYDHFSSQRDGYYSAESLDRFSRDNFADFEVKPFDELKEEATVIARNTLTFHRGDSGLKRLGGCIQNIQSKAFANNALHTEINSVDKTGLCHHLVVDGVILSWIKK